MTKDPFNPAQEKMRLDLKRRVKIPPGLCKTLKSVCG